MATCALASRNQCEMTAWLTPQTHLAVHMMQLMNLFPICGGLLIEQTWLLEQHMAD
jgi:hypothetical protein